MKNKILFVCKNNRFRSKIAEAYFKKVNKNKKFRVLSAGVFKGLPVHKNVISIGKKFGIKINKKTKGLSAKLMKKIDIIIIVANNISPSLFKGKVSKIISWKISDTPQKNKKRIEIISKKIIKKVDKFLRNTK